MISGSSTDKTAVQCCQSSGTALCMLVDKNLTGLTDGVPY